MESQEILNKQELKHQHKLPCLNKGDEIRFSRDCYSIRDEVDIQSCNYDRQAILGGRCNNHSLNKIVFHYSLQSKKGERRSQTNGPDEEGFKIGGSVKLEDKFAFKKGSHYNTNTSTLEFQLCRTLLCRSRNFWCATNNSKLII